MKTNERTVKVVTYASEVCPEVTSERESDGEIIAWADAHPAAWKIVTTSKSGAFGKGSSDHMGWAQNSDSPSAILDRIQTLRRAIEGNGDITADRNEFWRWRATFTLEHYGKKGFKSGFFQQFDGQYPRGCVTLDYTPETRAAVIERFRAWCDASPCRYETRAIWIDGVAVLEVEPEVDPLS
jgi:hypothetical protein